MITIIKSILILLAVLLSPIYGAWILCGWIADRAGQRRVSMLKGMLRDAA